MSSSAVTAMTLALLLLAPACSAKGSGDGTDTEMGSQTTPSSEGSGETGCTFPDDVCDIVNILCGEISSIGSPGCGSQRLVNDGHRCVARALRDNTPGLVSPFFTGGSQDELPCGFHDTIRILGDGTAVILRIGVGGGPIIIPLRRVEIRPPEFFEPCVDSDEFETVQACLIDWFVPDSCVPGACCPGPNEAGHPLCD